MELKRGLLEEKTQLVLVLENTLNFVHIGEWGMCEKGPDVKGQE